MTFLFMLGVTCLAAAGGDAATKPSRSLASQIQECGAKQTQMDMNVCAANVRKRADKNLNASLDVYRNRLDPKKTKMFDDAQRAWLKFRDSWCRFQASGAEGGSAQPFAFSVCVADITDQRMRQLEYVTTCEEGDMSCPVP